MKWSEVGFASPFTNARAEPDFIAMSEQFAGKAHQV